MSNKFITICKKPNEIYEDKAPLGRNTNSSTDINNRMKTGRMNTIEYLRICEEYYKYCDASNDTKKVK